MTMIMVETPPFVKPPSRTAYWLRSGLRDHVPLNPVRHAPAIESVGRKDSGHSAHIRSFFHFNHHSSLAQMTVFVGQSKMYAVKSFWHLFPSR